MLQRSKETQCQKRPTREQGRWVASAVCRVSNVECQKRPTSVKETYWCQKRPTSVKGRRVASAAGVHVASDTGLATGTEYHVTCLSVPRIHYRMKRERAYR